MHAGKRRPALPVLAALVTVLLAFAAGDASARSHARITVYAAASLTDVFPKIDASPRYQFAGSNTLAAQIAQGAPADVFASANTTLPNELFARRLCSKPVVFTRNTLVVVVPRSNPAGIRSVYDLTTPDVKVVVANSAVPVGRYTREVLENLHLTARVEANVVSREANVREVLAKVALGEADAGLVYSTDAKTVADRVRVVQVAARAQPTVKYGMCVVSSSSHERDARAFVGKVLSKSGQAKLLAHGFLPRAKPAPKRTTPVSTTK